MNNPEERRFREALHNLQVYCDDSRNPLGGQQFSEFVDEMFAAHDALLEVEAGSSLGAK